MKLHKASYGLKRSPRLWYQLFPTALEELGMMPVPSVNCLFTDGTILVLFYVNDCYGHRTEGQHHQ
ncbi:hypothetical protein M501DRAFT_432357 [Patellaria atrata CBS 101060]|uniref:Reverse transcriptase Ty1/copia-type domain-containing protein n=1 Tax=Patellaria atrata CBS 101060 TaxID=1346257 RepID=A0A9P4SHF5_9PEZI|nr:hypothetical protein M501DRAFT_432357 [Patellaria atrata CBS 101060]